jgi:two-component system cell cycle sensor histidine kinase/response regulator CckA
MAAGSSPHNAICILVADDEDLLRSLMQEVLERNGYEVLTASDGAEALAVYSTNANRISLLVSDIKMPHLTGVEVAKRILAERPETRILLTSGTTVSPSPSVAFLWKPFTLDDFMTKVKDVLDSPPAILADIQTGG